MTVPIYGKRSPHALLGDRLSLGRNNPIYAQVLVDLPAKELGNRLFTYRVPDYLVLSTFIGTHVLVPFGHQKLVGGYVISLVDQFSGQFHPKDITEVLDTDPLFDSKYIEFLYFISDYCMTSLSSVIQAAVPADFTPRFKRVVAITSSYWLQEENTINLEAQDKTVKSFLQTLRVFKQSCVSLRVLKQRTKLPPAQFYRTLHLLKGHGVLDVKTESSKPISVKVVNTVIWTGKAGTTARQDAIIGTLKLHNGQMHLAQLIKVVGTTHATIKKMATQGIVCLSEKEVLRDPITNICLDDHNRTSSLPTLTHHQEVALLVLQEELHRVLQSKIYTANGRVEPWLLYGITGSGKTEVYLRLIRDTIEHGRTALFLVPEISLTPQLAQRLKSRFGNQVAVWHSALSPGERFDTWRRLKANDVKVLLGARSAILVSMPQLGLIIIDEEHDASYKQSNPSPRYNAKTLACQKAQQHGAMVVLGSATPDVCTYLAARENNQILELPERISQQELPAVQLVDMRNELRNGNYSIFSSKLINALSNCLSQNEQAILLINRRGFASHVFCRACGFVAKCRNCSVSLVFHQPTNHHSAQAKGHLSCHHCGHNVLYTSICPNCQSPFLKQYGLGTQRVEHEISNHFPQARLLRLDSDTAARKGAFEKIFHEFSAGKADILIGTQMVSKGLDIPKVTLVGVLAADAAFNLPDYRTMERGFQLLTQVSGRAGRGERPGSVIMQTYNTEIPALLWAQQHNYKSFFEQEISTRKEFGYPPFSQLIRVVITGLDELAVEYILDQLAEELTHFLEDTICPSLMRLLGPAPCLIERIQGKFRRHILIKNYAGEKGRLLLSRFLQGRGVPANVSLSIDIDAMDLI